MGGHLYSLPPNFAGSVVAFDTNQLGTCISIRKGVYIAHKPNLDDQEVEFCFKGKATRGCVGYWAKLICRFHDIQAINNFFSLSIKE